VALRHPDLVKDRTAHINRLRWHLHELDLAGDPPPRCLVRYNQLDAVAAPAGKGRDHGRPDSGRPRGSNPGPDSGHQSARGGDHGLGEQTGPTLLALVGVGRLGAAKIVAAVADVRRFKSKDAFARHNGTAPLPVWSGTVNATGWHAQATGNSTPRSTASPSPRSDATPRPPPTSNGEPPGATPKPKHSAPSGADCPTSSTQHHSPTRPPPPVASPRPLDIGARHVNASGEAGVCMFDLFTAQCQR
jgi:Transposase IS116/IS110/IS902 family